MPLEDGVHHPPAHQAVVPRAVHDVGIAEAVDDLVEHPGKKAADGRLALAVGAAGGGAVVVLLQQRVQHLGQKGGRVLQVRVHHGHIVALCGFQPRQDARLLAEVAGKADVAHPGVLFVQLAGDGKGLILGAVVHKDEFKIRPVARLHLFSHPADLFIKVRQRLLLVVAGHHDGKQHSATAFAFFFILSQRPGHGKRAAQGAKL